ncbi:MAG: RNA polymerase sigma factor [Psychroserpens sp.]|uniref:RNA polymerase sigma factor n=1 Tax=Psychroserpens sp. TaxID=2020870 RepID=UPI003C715D41
MSKDALDLQLQILLRADDKKALETVYLKNQDAFINYAKSLKIDSMTALDIYQDSVIAMHQNFVTRQLRLETSSVKTYLFAIGKHKIYSFLNTEKRKVNSNHDTLEFEEIQLEESAPTELQIQLSQNLKLISESCQTVLRLFYYRGLTIDEIVEQTDYKDSNTVRSHKSRCMKRLKTLFKVK